MTNRYDLNRYYHSGSVDLGVMTMKGYSPDLNNWSLTIRCSLVSYRILSPANKVCYVWSVFYILVRKIHETLWGLYVILVISVDVHSYFTGIALLIIPTTNTTQNFTIAWKKWNKTQRTLNNKQFNMHITEYENKQNTWYINGLLENKVWLEENKFV